MKKINDEHLVGFFCIILSIIVLILSSKLPKGRSEFNIPGPNFFPIILGFGILLCGIYQVILGFIKKDTAIINFKEVIKQIKNPQVITILIIIGLLLFFLIFFEIIGFVICLIIMMFIIMIRFKVKIIKMILSIIIFIGIIILIFETIFHITLPLRILNLF